MDVDAAAGEFPNVLTVVVDGEIAGAVESEVLEEDLAGGGDGSVGELVVGVVAGCDAPLDLGCDGRVDVAPTLSGGQARQEPSICNPVPGRRCRRTRARMG